MTDLETVKIAAVALFTPDDRLILQRRGPRSRLRSGWLSFLGGHVGDHIETAAETSLDAAWREVFEETSLTREDVRAPGLTLIARFLLTNEMTGGDGIFDVDLYRGTLNAAEPEFEMYQGATTEIYTVAQADSRSDLVTAVRYAIDEKII